MFYIKVGLMSLIVRIYYIYIGWGMVRIYI